MPVIATPERPLNDLARHVGKMVDQMQKGYFGFSPNEVWAPNVNLYETEQSYLVCVDLAGVDKEKIDITVEGRMLRLQGKREVPIPEEESPERRVRVHLMEIDHGAFSRNVELPLGVKEDSITARYENGVLWIELPK